MTSNPAKTLEILFAISQSAIDRELRDANGRLLEISKEIESLNQMPLELRTDEIEAKMAHLEMIRAHELCRDNSFLPEIKTFYVAKGAGWIAQDVESVAWNKDSLAELSAQMDAIRRREGLSEGQYWMHKNGPPDYLKLDQGLGEILANIWDTIFPYLLRRYRLDDHAKLFELDRATFEIEREIGARLILPSYVHDERNALTDTYFRKEYGENALMRLKSRLREISGQRERK